MERQQLVIGDNFWLLFFIEGAGRLLGSLAEWLDAFANSLDTSAFLL